MTALDITPVPDYRQLARLDGKGYVVIGAGQGSAARRPMH
jgi:hypothetical protein